MPLPSNQYYPLFPIQEQLTDVLLGIPLAAGTVTFFEDQDRTVPKDVYQRTENPDNTFTYTNIGSVLTLSGIGTFVSGSGDNIIPFLWPFTGLPTDIPPSTEIQLYYIVVESSGSVPQFTVSAWPPEVIGGSSSANEFIGSQNIVSNPQFAVVNFTSPTTYTVAVPSTIPIAPDWNVITTGTGSVTVTQIAVTDPGAPGLPAFALDITSSGISTLTLSQTITMSPRILEDSFVSGTFIVESDNATSPLITMNYVPSDPALSSITLASGIAVAGGYTLINGNVDLSSLTTNPDSGSDGYVNIQFVIPPNCSIRLSCVQVVSVQDSVTTPIYIQESTPRQIDHLFHYYNPQLQYKPIPSYLVGWDFALNPCQALGTSPGAVTQGIANNSYYVADQTILFQSVDASFTMAQGQYGFTFTASNTSSLALVQYIPQAIALELLTGRMSIALAAGTNQASINGTVNLYWTATTLPSLLTPTFASLVSSIAAGPITTVAAGWNAVPRTLSTASFTLTAGGVTPLTFNDFDATAVTTSSATFMAIVISFDALTAANTLTLQYCSLNSGDIATRPAPQTIDQVLRECQYYYETSYDIGIVPGTASTSTGSYIRNMTTSFVGGNSYNFPTFFTVEYKSLKYADVPDLTFYSPVSGTAGNVYAEIYYNGSTIGTPADATILGNFDGLNGSQKSIDYKGSTTTALITATSDGGNASNAIISFHWTSDARLGII